MKSIIYILIICLSFASCKDPVQEDISVRSILISKAKKETLSRLKSPSGAVFFDSITRVEIMKDSDSVYMVRQKLDALNAFGTPIRESYMILFIDKGGDSLDVSNYEFYKFY